jgi:hypothetical protein
LSIQQLNSDMAAFQTTIIRIAVGTAATVLLTVLGAWITQI